MPPRKHSVARNTAAMAVGQVGSKFLLLLSMMLLSRYLTDTPFGGLMFAAALGQLLWGIVDMGVSGIVNRQVSVKPSSAQRIFSVALGLRIVLFVAALGLLLGISAVSGAEPWEVLFIGLVGAGMAFEAVCELHFSVFRARERMIHEAVTRISAGVVSVILVILVLRFDLGAKMAVATYLARSLVVVVVSSILVYRIFRIRVVPSFRFGSMWGLFREAAPLAVMALFMFGAQKLDNVVIRTMLSVEHVGAYQECFKLLEAAILIINPTLIPGALFPWLCQSFASGWKKARKSMAQLTQLVVGLSLLVSIPLMSGGFSLLRFLWGGGFLRGVGASEMLGTYMLVIASIPFFFWLVALQGGIVAARRQRVAAKVGLTGMVVNVVTNLILLPRIGLMGAGVAVILSDLVMAFLFYAALSRKRPLPVFGEIWKPALAAIPAAVSALLLSGAHALVRLAVPALAFILVWLPLGGLNMLRTVREDRELCEGSG
ncbi:oligosaccharide flippase family protein [Candidatus Fermentibacteria bacterium]|nr:oligosaccharide flippase family protein [Candidatus Fermentibacteria bacterium]